MALLSFGEGWHNNHHAHPVSARHGLAWYELDMNCIGIKPLEKLAWPGTSRSPDRQRRREIVPQESPDAVDISRPRRD